jgi:hypothetical protein
MSLSPESPTSIPQSRLSHSPTNLLHFLRVIFMIKSGIPPNNRLPLIETSTTITINTISIVPHHISLINKRLHISSRDSTSRLLHLPLEPNIQSPDPWNRPTSPRGLTASAKLPCLTINPRSTPMVSQVLLQVHGFKIPVCSRSLRLADLLHGCLVLDRLNSIIPINRSDAEYLVELPHPYL